ncbi:MAG: GMC family oxidoreductase [Bryobacteraceae bacterium]|nr:GMC family oxidoreductase [Bryobacteraceae bacterium]
MTRPPIDAVVIGAGAGGGVVAHQLANAGLRVALLERGRDQQFHETRHDELRSQRTTVLGNAFGPDDSHTRLVQLGEDAEFRRVVASDGAYGNVAACVGGGTKSFGAMAWRFMEQDFRMRSTYGAVAGSTLEDWPLTYQDLEPFYERAEWEIGVSGRGGANPFEAPRRKGYPMPPLPLGREATVLMQGAWKLGWHPFPIPMAINSVPYMGRPGCVMCPHCVGFACEVKAKSSTADTVIPRAVATGNCELRTQCTAKEVLLDSQGRARAVAYFEGRTLVEQPCRLVVVSASATESARLLLNSRSKLFPNGLGNRYDWVGRNLQGHAYAGAYGLFGRDLWDGLGPAARVALCDFNHGNTGLVGGAMLANEFIRLPYLFASGIRPPGVPAWGRKHKEFMRANYKREAGVQGPVQEMPRWENRVYLDPKEKDEFGIPILRLQGKRHENDFVVAKAMVQKATQWLRAAGAHTVWPKMPGKGVNGGQHQAGTCRMGVDAKTSVVNKYCQLHDVDNVFVVDGSVLVTNGGFNPSLTILAVAYWASAYMARNFKAGGRTG